MSACNLWLGLIWPVTWRFSCLWLNWTSAIYLRVHALTNAVHGGIGEKREEGGWLSWSRPVSTAVCFYCSCSHSIWQWWVLWSVWDLVTSHSKVQVTWLFDPGTIYLCATELTHATDTALQSDICCLTRYTAGALSARKSHHLKRPVETINSTAGTITALFCKDFARSSGLWIMLRLPSWRFLNHQDHIFPRCLLLLLVIEFNQVLQSHLSMWCPPVSAKFNLNMFSAYIPLAAI